MSIHTKESLKEKATIIRKFLKEKCDADISHSHSLELISKIFGFKDWNTASAMSESKPKVKQNSSPIQIETVGDMKKALEAFDDSAMIDAYYTFKVKELADIELEEPDPEDEIDQEFSFTLEDCSDKDIASFKLKLEHESMTSFSASGFSGWSLK